MSLAPILYIPHGGGPLPVLGDPHHRALANFLTKIPQRITPPTAILVISAHWEAELATLTYHAQPELIYDYYGFPDEAYQLHYPAKGYPALAKSIAEHLQNDHYPIALDEQRGFDHGMFIPLMLMYPNADIPVLQLSLLRSLDPEAHVQLGEKLAFLRQQNVLILGSGMSFHNIQTFFSPSEQSTNKSHAFDLWLQTTCLSTELNESTRKAMLINWQQAPQARFCHPREEHLLPLHICLGAASGAKAELVFNEKLMAASISSFLWQ